jgi:endonuclease-3
MVRRITPEIIPIVLRRLRRAARTWRVPSVSQLAEARRDPFRVLAACILSLRTRDETTRPAAKRLFALADTPEHLARVPVRAIERAIYPVGFYRTKARTLRALSRRLTEEHGGKVPDAIEDLLAIKGVGRKTANLVVTVGFGKPGICVDTHVHRISNRWGLVGTKTPEQTEFALRERLPKRYWIRYNDLLVSFGQTICHPTSPRCSACALIDLCPRIGGALAK